MDFVVEALKILVPAFVIIIGWVIVHDLTQERDVATARRKALLDQLDLLVKLSEDTLAVARDYHTMAREAELERQILANFTYMGMIASSLNQLGLPDDAQDAVLKAHNSFKKSATKSHFSEEHIEPWSATAPEMIALGVVQGLLRGQLIQARIRALRSADTMTIKMLARRRLPRQ